MTYIVQISDSNGGGFAPSHELPVRFATIQLAEEAGLAESSDCGTRARGFTTVSLTKMASRSGRLALPKSQRDTVLCSCFSYIIPLDSHDLSWLRTRQA